MPDATRWYRGARLALTTFSVAPVRPGRVDRDAAGAAMALAPLVGAGLGAAGGALALGSRALHAPALVIGGLVVALDALLTRGLHLDGLADTADGLGSYAPRERALAIMRQPDVGPFGVVAIVLALLLQAASVAGLTDRSGPALLVAVLVAAATGRLAVAAACRTGVPPARPEGLGALVAGTVRWPFLAADAAAVLAVSVAAVPGRPWQGPLAVAAALLATAGLGWHTVRRLGGVTGDVLGATLVLAVTVAYLGLVMG